MVCFSKDLALCFMYSDQNVKYQLSHGFPLINRLLLDYHIKTINTTVLCLACPVIELKLATNRYT